MSDIIKEVRTYNIDVELREDNDLVVLTGYASVFNKMSEDLGGFREIVKPGAFKKTLQEADVRALWNHDPNYVLARSKNNTLRMSEDINGLKVEIDPIMENTWTQDLVRSIKRGDIDQMSFGFRVIKDAWIEDKDTDTIIREIREVALYDVSPVTYPAYPQTSITVKRNFTNADLLQTLIKIEKDLTLSKKDDRIINEIRELLKFDKPEKVENTESQKVAHRSRIVRLKSHDIV